MKMKENGKMLCKECGWIGYPDPVHAVCGSCKSPHLTAAPEGGVKVERIQSVHIMDVLEALKAVTGGKYCTVQVEANNVGDSPSHECKTRWRAYVADLTWTDYANNSSGMLDLVREMIRPTEKSTPEAAIVDDAVPE